MTPSEIYNLSKVAIRSEQRIGILQDIGGKLLGDGRSKEVENMFNVIRNSQAPASQCSDHMLLRFMGMK